MYRLILLGGASLEGPSGPLTGPAAQPRRLALLSVLAVEGDSGCSRDKLIGLLWPDSDADRARHHLSQSLYVLRQALGAEAVTSTGERVRLDPACVSADCREFDVAVGRSDLESAVRVYSGSFLDGFFLRDSGAFEEWADSERRRLAGDYAEALESLAEGAEKAGDPRSAARWWERLSIHDPYNSRAVVGWMEALVAAGDPGNAVQVAREHERRLRDEFDLAPAPEVHELTRRLRESLPVTTTAEERTAISAESASSSSDLPGVRPLGTDATRRSWRRWWLGAVAALAVLAVGWVSIAGRSRERARAPIESVAVIPFVNFTGETEFDYFADGIADELISALSRFPELRVPAQTSSFHFRGSDLDARAIGDSLGVQAIIEGSVRKEQGRVRVNVQLIDARDGYHLSTETYDRRLDSWMATQAEITRATIQALDLELPEGWVPPKLTRDVSAWQDYQKAYHWWLKRTKQGTDTAIVYFRRAVDADSTYARAWAGLANTYITGAFWRHIADSDSLRLRLWDMADRSVRLDPTLAEGVTTRAGLLYDEGELEASEKEYLRAIALSPNYAVAHQWYVDLLSRVGRHKQALEEARLAYDLDPLSPIIIKVLGDALRNNMLLEEAIIYWDFAIAIEPDHWSGYANKSRALACLGRFEESREAALGEIKARGEWDHAARTLYLIRDYEGALGMIERMRDTIPAASAELASRVHAELGDWDQAIAEYRTVADEYTGDAWTALMLAYIYARMGEETRARAILEAPGNIDDEPSVAWHSASVHAVLGDKDRAFELLEQAYRGRKSQVMTLAVNPRFDPLREDPRFEEFLERVGLPSVDVGGTGHQGTTSPSR